MAARASLHHTAPSAFDAHAAPTATGTNAAGRVRGRAPSHQADGPVMTPARERSPDNDAANGRATHSKCRRDTSLRVTRCAR